MEPQWGGEKSLTAAERDHTLTDRVCAFKTSWAECRDQKRCRHRANGGDFSLDVHSYRTILRWAIWSFFSFFPSPKWRGTGWLSMGQAHASRFRGCGSRHTRIHRDKNGFVLNRRTCREGGDP